MFKKLKYKLYEIKYEIHYYFSFIRRLIDYIPVIFNDSEEHLDYILDLIKFRLIRYKTKLQREIKQKGPKQWELKEIKRIKVLLGHLDRRNDAFNYVNFKQFDSKAFSEEQLSLHMDGWLQDPNIDHNELRKFWARLTEFEKYHWSEFCRLLHKYGE